MQKFFGDNYYGEEDVEKPQFDDDFEGSDFFYYYLMKISVFVI